jgi:hypothetical protein
MGAKFSVQRDGYSSFFPFLMKFLDERYFIVEMLVNSSLLDYLRVNLLLSAGPDIR